MTAHEPRDLSRARALDRREFLARSIVAQLGLGALANPSLRALVSGAVAETPGPHHRPRARRLISLFQSGGPSHLDLFDPKPGLAARAGEEVPRSVYPDERKTQMSSHQSSFPAVPSRFHFVRRGDCGMEMSELLPALGEVADELCLIRSMHTHAINHDPAITFLLTGSEMAGRPSMGAWVHYGLGSMNADLPAFVAMTSRGSGRQGQPLYDRLWGSGFLPTTYQGVKLRNQGPPVLDLLDPAGIDRGLRRHMLDAVGDLDRLRSATQGAPGVEAKVEQWELAYRLQSSVPELTDLSTEPASTFTLYGEDARRPGSYAYNCLMARRLVERGVRFVQLFHRGWDQHDNLPKQIREQCGDTDRASAALVVDLRRRGLLDDTLVVWGGEFGRTVYSQGKLRAANYGRDHHPGVFSVWLAGAGVRRGHVHGASCDWGVRAAEDPVSVHDLHATLLHLLGLDHLRLTHRHEGRDHRLTDVAGELVPGILA